MKIDIYNKCIHAGIIVQYLNHSVVLILTCAVVSIEFDNSFLKPMVLKKVME